MSNEQVERRMEALAECVVVIAGILARQSGAQTQDTLNDLMNKLERIWEGE